MTSIKGIKVMFGLMLASLTIAYFWNKISFISNTAHAVLDPSAGNLILWSPIYGFAIVVFVISLFITIVNKLTLDHDTMREIKKEQKLLQEEIKKYKDDPEKMLELNRKQLEFFPKTINVTMRPAIFTFIPLILLFRWFNDFFTLHEVSFIGLSWFWAYLILTIIFSTTLRKLFRIP